MTHAYHITAQSVQNLYLIISLNGIYTPVRVDNNVNRLWVKVGNNTRIQWIVIDDMKLCVCEAWKAQNYHIPFPDGTEL